MLVEVEAEQAGQQLAGSRPPDEVGQDPAQEERREQATQDPRDAGRRLLSRVLPGADRVSEGRRGGGEWGSRAQAPGVATCRRCEWSLRVGPAGPGSVTTCLDSPRIQGPPPRPLILLQSASSRGWAPATCPAFSSTPQVLTTPPLGSDPAPRDCTRGPAP